MSNFIALSPPLLQNFDTLATALWVEHTNGQITVEQIFDITPKGLGIPRRVKICAIANFLALRIAVEFLRFRSYFLIVAYLRSQRNHITAIITLYMAIKAIYGELYIRRE